MSNVDYTLGQRKAIDSRGSVSVRAGAGSGKTRVLTARYRRALEKNLVPADIVAITFTEKAAAEMRERIRDAIGQIDKDASEIARLQELLADAPISTIHAFCAGLLHEFPVEAGVDPAFEVAEESRSWQLRRQAVDAAIAEAAADSKHPARPHLDTLLTFYPRRQVADMLAEILDKRRYFPDETCRLLELQPNELAAKWQWLLRKEICAVMHAIAGNAAVASLVAELASRADQCADSRDKLYEKVRLILDAFDELAGNSEEGALAAAAALGDALLTKDGKPRGFSRVASAGNWPGGTLEEVKRLLGDLARHMTPLKSLRKIALDDTDRLIARVVHSLWRLVVEVEAEYRAIKGNGRVLDFDDLESDAIALLESERGKSIRETIRKRYRLILVDESQDLNFLQFRLITLLLDSHSQSKANDLFVVGDPQQSIFAFRNADVRLFDEIREKLVPRSASHLPLGNNFRSTPALVAFANRLFAGLMTGGEDFDVTYSPMQADRKPEFDSSIELLLPNVPDDTHDYGGERDDPRARAIAERITALVENGPERVPDDRKKGEGNLRRPNYGEIAILLRTRNPLPALLDAFCASNIPCTVYKGIGFYQTQEVRDVYTCFRFLADPSRDLDLAGLLRSPFFGLSDDGLFLLAHGRGDATLYDELLKPRRPGEFSAKDQNVVERAQALIPSWLSMVDLAKPSSLLHRLLDDTGAWGIFSAMGSAGTLRKLLRVLRGFQASGASLAQVVEVLDEHIHNVPREGIELDESLSDNTVKIMTVHAAKGLEFPIVFVVGLDDNLKRGGPPSALQVDPDLGFALDTPPALRDAENKGAIHQLIAERSRRKELAEARRLLYVACTRAQDHLFLVGNSEKRPPAESWQRWILDSLGVSDNGALRDVVIGEGVTLRIVREAPRAPESLPSPEVFAGVEQDGDTHREAVDIEQLARLLAPIPPKRHQPAFSVTQLRDFERCPRLYYVRHVLGIRFDERPMLPDDVRDEYPDEEDHDGDQRILGVVVHALLEQFGATTSTTLEAVAQRTAYNETSKDARADQLAYHAVEIVRSLTKSELGASLLKAESFRELPFALRLDGAILRGRIDRLFEGTPPLVVDFKLPREPHKATRESLDEKYGLQLRAYSLAVSRLLETDVVRAAIVLPETKASFEWKYGPDDLARIERELVERIAAITVTDLPELFRSGPCCGRCIVCRTMPAATATRT